MRKLTALFALSLALSMQAQQHVMTVDVSKPTAKIQPEMYGIFFEEINHAGDGGLYAELVKNRSFEELEMPEGYYAEGRIAALAFLLRFGFFRRIAGLAFLLGFGFLRRIFGFSFFFGLMRGNCESVTARRNVQDKRTFYFQRPRADYINFLTGEIGIECAEPQVGVYNTLPHHRA